jgi:signal transduction histidine kinase/ligand-binding sensor domain-containing protein
MRRAGFIGIVFLFVLQAGVAQDFLHSTRNYTILDGLPQSQVVNIQEDGNGYLWIATQGGGLAQFDGREFKVYTTKDGLLSNNILGVFIDHHQNIWSIHDRGMTRFNGEVFKRFDHSNIAKPARWYRVLFEKGDSLFFLSNLGVAKIYQDSVFDWRKPVTYDSVPMKKMIRAPGGYYCYLRQDNTYFVHTPDGSFSIPLFEDIGEPFSSFNYKKNIGLRTEKGFYQLDLENRELQPLPLPLKHDVLLYDEKRDVFWTVNESTLFRESIRDGKLEMDTVLEEIRVNSVMVDSEGNTWFASDGQGIYKYFIQDFNRRSTDNIRGVMAILHDRCGATWLGTLNKGLYRIANGKVQTFNDPKEPERSAVVAIRETPDGAIWVASNRGLGRYDNESKAFRWYTPKDGLAGMRIFDLAVDEKGGLWVATANGLSYFNGKTFKNYRSESGLISNLPWPLYYSIKRKTLYIGSDAILQTIHKGKINKISVPGLANTSIISILPYQDSLLTLGTGGAGTIIFNPVTRESKFITSQDGVASDFIYFAVEDESKNIWIGSEKGINRVKLNDKLEVDENLYYGYDNGLIGVETNSNAFSITPDDKYFGLVDGLYSFNDLSHDPGKSFDIHLTDVRLFYGDYRARDYSDSTSGFFKLPVNPQLPPDRNHITFVYNRVDKRYPKSIKFKYFLEGFDKKWSIPSSMTEVTYSNLPPGSYVFHVMSTDKQGSWSYRTVRYPFSIKAPFYKTASFAVGMLVLLAGIVTLILYLRVRQKVNKMMMLERIRVKEQENLRKEIARDFHDEMGNQLTRIINYISLLKLNGNGSATNGSADLYTKVEDSAKYLYNGTRDFIWSIDPVNDELSKLFIHIRDFGEKLFEEKGMQFRAYNDVKDKIKLPYGFSREANLIFKEAMTNAFKYSNAKNVTWILRRESTDTFEMRIEDDGIGFSTDEMQKSNGLQNIKERADKINGILRIQTEKQSGTQISLTFKLTKTLKYGLTL